MTNRLPLQQHRPHEASWASCLRGGWAIVPAAIQGAIRTRAQRDATRGAAVRSYILPGIN